MSVEPSPPGTTRREVLKKGVFVAPVVLTLTAVPSFASAGSGSGRPDGGRPGDDWRPRRDDRPQPRRRGPGRRD
jgi:hypothetical protein